MKRFPIGRTGAWLAAILLLGSGAALGAPPPLSARDVVVRGRTDLTEVLAAATRDAWADPESSRAVAVVVDVTPNTKGAADLLRGSFDALGDRIAHLGGSWRIAALGRGLSEPVRHPSGLGPAVSKTLAEETPEVNTLRALRKTLAGFRERGGVVLYLADWRFEDDDGLEGFIGNLRSRGQRLRVIGSEACFGRAWNDGIPRFSLEPEAGDATVGRSPFGKREPGAPWHGGDSAYPHAPYSFGNLPWHTEFPVPLRLDRPGLGRKGLEDLGERVGRLRAESPGFRDFPLASAYGPYSLMRAAAMTGGHYYLWSWNPSGRVDVTYDYSKCNLFEPDLRRRREILADARGRPLPAAMLKVWHDLSHPDVAVTDLTPPTTTSGAPAEIGKIRGDGELSFAWLAKSDYDRFMMEVVGRITVLDSALTVLDRALAPPAPRSGPGPRYHADARLLRHTLRVIRFELREAQAAALKLPADVWEKEEKTPALMSVDWIRPGSDPEKIEVTRARPFDLKEGERVRVARLRHLETYGGTPFGEIVARNPVVTWRVQMLPRLEGLDPSDIGRTPSESGRERRDTPEGGRPGPGGSSGGGPASGK